MIVPRTDLEAYERETFTSEEYREFILAPYREIGYWQERWAGSYVYFVREETKGPVKIGTARNPLARLKGLQTGNPRDLFLCHVLVGNIGLERELHGRLGDAAMVGEWFGGGLADAVCALGRGIAAAQIAIHRSTRAIVTDLDALISEASS